MYNVLIADDEPGICEGMQIIIDWKRYNFRVLDTAWNGAEALDKIRTGRYNLVITDIRMPVLDGIEFISKVKAYNPSIRILIISGYSDFSYAKKALDYGVMGYLLKPIDSEELTDFVLKVKKELDNELRNGLITRENTNILKDKFFYDFVRNALTTEEANEKQERLNIVLPDQYFGIALLEIDNFIKIIGQGLEDAKLLMFSIRNIVEELTDRDGNGFVYQENQGVLGLLVFGGKDDLVFENIRKKFYYIFECISKYLKIKVTIGYGGFAEGCSGLKAIWQKAQLVLERKVMAGDSNIISYEQVNRKEINISDIHWEPKALLTAVEYNNDKAMKEEADALTNELSEKSASQEIIKALLYNILFELLRMIKEHNGDSSKVFGSSFEVDQVFESMRMKQINEWLCTISKKASSHINDLKNCKSDAIINQVKKYIDSNFYEDLSLKSIAVIFFLSPAYLGQLFKNTLKESFNDYINRLRVSEAKKLMLNGDIKIKDLIEKVGYSNAEYFYKIFKKYEGVSYQEFKQLI